MFRFGLDLHAKMRSWPQGLNHAVLDQWSKSFAEFCWGTRPNPFTLVSSGVVLVIFEAAFRPRTTPACHVAGPQCAQICAGPPSMYGTYSDLH